MPHAETLIKILIAEYIVIAAVAGYQGRWPWVLYYVSASLISVAVIWMGQSK